MTQTDAETTLDSVPDMIEGEEQLQSEDILPQKRSGDKVLTAAGFVLATVAALFPWYVFFNQESFGIAPMSGYSETRDLSGMQAGPVLSVSPLAIPNDNNGLAQTSAFDPIITATVPNPQGEDIGTSITVEPVPDQSFPGQPRYRLLHVANGRALIEDKSGMYVVRIGSVLPDNSRLATLEQRDGDWVIVTSNGEVITR